MPSAVGGASGVYESAEPVAPPESDFNYKKIPEKTPNRVVINKYTGKETKVIIPEEIEGLPVSNITASAFSESVNLTYVKLPASLTGISGKAFSMCSSLTSFDIDPANPVFSVIDGVLYRRDTYEESETYGELKTLSAFPAGKGGRFTVPYGIKTIAAYAFDHCYSLTSVSMYNTVTDIYSGAFSYCWNLESIHLSDNLKTLDSFALAHCDSLSRIDLPASLTNIGADAVLGGIDSKDNKFYYFVDGISCKKDSYAYKYLVAQALPLDIIIPVSTSISDLATGVKLVDEYNVLPPEQEFDISVKEVDLKEVEHLLPTRYSEALAFDIALTKQGTEYSPKGKIFLNFDAVCPYAIPSATKVYQQIGEELVLVSGAANAPFVGAQTEKTGRFIILINDDFSLKGDVDGDGIITLFDVKAALHASANTLTLTPEQKLAANVDNSQDGKITTADTRKILRLAGGMSAE